MKCILLNLLKKLLRLRIIFVVTEILHFCADGSHSRSNNSTNNGKMRSDPPMIALHPFQKRLQ